jgi:crotonobetainyl-CoA:carnitine CoA-transferase CaiB-like acyl-CoA transferase
MSANGTSPGPLEGLHVLDISSGRAGPFCAKLLGDLGASVIKVEAPGPGGPPAGGDGDTSEADLDAAAARLYVEGSKRSITLDLDDAAARPLLRRLLATWDIVVASETEPALAARGLGMAALAEWNPAAILVTVTGFGSSGPYRDYASTHLITCAAGGWAIACGSPDREPLQAGANLTDFVAGGYAAAALLGAVEQRARDGSGQHVDVSAQEAAITAALLPTLIYEYAGALPERHSDYSTGPSFIMQCRDGNLGVNVLTQPHWEGLCLFTGHPELLEKPEYAAPASRYALANEIRELLAPFFAERSATETFHEAQAWRLPFGLIPSMTEVLSLLPHGEREFLVPVEHPSRPGEGVLVPGVPFAMAKTPAHPGRPPQTGEHNDEIFRGILGLTAEELAGLRAEGVV